MKTLQQWTELHNLPSLFREKSIYRENKHAYSKSYYANLGEIIKMLGEPNLDNAALYNSKVHNYYWMKSDGYLDIYFYDDSGNRDATDIWYCDAWKVYADILNSKNSKVYNYELYGVYDEFGWDVKEGFTTGEADRRDKGFKIWKNYINNLKKSSGNNELDVSSNVPVNQSVVSNTEGEKNNAVGIKKIFIIDNCISSQYSLTPELERKGFQVFYADTGKKGIIRAKAQKPNLILLAPDLPYVDGFEIYRQIRAEEKIKNTPVIMMINKTEQESILGQSDLLHYMLTPFKTPDLFNKIVEIIGDPKSAKPIEVDRSNSVP